MLIGHWRPNRHAATQHPAPSAINQPVAAVHRRASIAIARARVVACDACAHVKRANPQPLWDAYFEPIRRCQLTGQKWKSRNPWLPLGVQHDPKKPFRRTVFQKRLIALDAARSRRCLPAPARPVSGLPRRQRWSASAAVWRSLGNGIRRSRCNSRCRIAGRGICFSLFVGVMDWRRIGIIASDATRLWCARRKASLNRCYGRSFPSSTTRFRSICTR